MLQTCNSCIVRHICEQGDEEYRKQCMQYNAYCQGYDEAVEKAWTLFQKYATFMHPQHEQEEYIMHKYQFIEALKNL